MESVISKLLANADNDVERAERGIVYIDEIDKLAKKENANQRDVSGESVQQALLKLLEGADIEVRRLTKHGHIGFESQLKDDLDKDENILSKVETEDIRSYGLIPEFIGRLPIVFALQQMDEKLLVKVLKEPKNAIVKQYKKLFAMDGVKLDFDEGALLEIAHRAVEKKTGARALRSILEETMLDIMYQIPKDDMIGHVTITQDYVKGVGGPRIEVRD